MGGDYPQALRWPLTPLYGGSVAAEGRAWQLDAYACQPPSHRATLKWTQWNFRKLSAANNGRRATIRSQDQVFVLVL